MVQIYKALVPYCCSFSLFLSSSLYSALFLMTVFITDQRNTEPITWSPSILIATYPAHHLVGPTLPLVLSTSEPHLSRQVVQAARWDPPFTNQDRSKSLPSHPFIGTGPSFNPQFRDGTIFNFDYVKHMIRQDEKRAGSEKSNLWKSDGASACH